MTLILTIANKNGVHQSSDYQLTDLAGKPVPSAVGTKQLERTFEQKRVRLAFTGIAKFGRRNTVDWLDDELSSLPHSTDVDTICSKLVHRCFAEIGSKVAIGSDNVLTLVLCVSEIGKPFRVVRISNSDFTPQHRVRQKEFFTEVFSVENGPFYRIDPSPDQLLTRQQRRQLKALSRAVKKPPEEIREELAQINAEAAKSSKGYVSKECWVGSLFQEGEQLKSEERNIGGVHGTVKNFAGDRDLQEAVEKLLKTNFPGGYFTVGSSSSIVPTPGKPKEK